MGNCIRHEPSMQWGGDDWGCMANGVDDHEEDMEEIMKKKKKIKMEEGQGGFEDLGAAGLAKKLGGATEVKVKITKKQLEELLGRVDLKQMSVQQVLAKLVSLGDRYEAHQRSWRPALQSIPEVN